MLRHKYPLPADLSKLIIFVIFVCHLGACLWHLVGMREAEATLSSWLIEYKLVGASWADRYASSIYWSTITVTTTGYGDLVAVYLLLFPSLVKQHRKDIRKRVGINNFDSFRIYSLQYLKHFPTNAIKDRLVQKLNGSS